MPEHEGASVIACPGCGTQVASRFLTCPNCQRLVHAEDLKRLAGEAADQESAGDLPSALVAWRSALELLPPASRQHETIRRKVEELGRLVDASPGPAKAGQTASNHSGWAGLATMGVMLFGKVKLLLLGLAKGKTLLTMFVSMGAYWTLYGWPLAVGLVLLIYVHEMGHVAALVRYGIKADAPMFIPGFGALIRMRQHLTSPRQEAQVGLGGPLWGTAAAAACFGLGYAIHSPIVVVIAKLGAIMNLFNLIPVWQLDGGRAFKAFSRPQRWGACVISSTMWATAGETEGIPFVILLAMMILTAFQAAFTAPSEEPDQVSFLEYIGLVVVLTLMARIPDMMP